MSLFRSALTSLVVVLLPALACSQGEDPSVPPPSQSASTAREILDEALAEVKSIGSYQMEVRVLTDNDDTGIDHWAIDIEPDSYRVLAFSDQDNSFGEYIIAGNDLFYRRCPSASITCEDWTKSVAELIYLPLTGPRWTSPAFPIVALQHADDVRPGQPNGSGTGSICLEGTLNPVVAAAAAHERYSRELGTPTTEQTTYYDQNPTGLKACISTETYLVEALELTVPASADIPSELLTVGIDFSNFGDVRIIPPNI